MKLALHWERSVYLFFRSFLQGLRFRELENADLENPDLANKDLKYTDVAQKLKPPLLASVMNLSPLVRVFFLFLRSVVCVFETPGSVMSFLNPFRKSSIPLN